MATVVLDFDSTLVPCESLELALARAPGVGPAELAEIEAVTRRGMEGEIAFRESLGLRLAIASPTRDGLRSLGEELAGGLTSGAPELVSRLHADGHAVWIVSGAFRETLLPPARALGIPADRVQGVRALWARDGAFAGLDDADGFATSKVEGARRFAASWPRPAVSVGDGATDHALLAAGLVDRFVAYVEHVRRVSVLSHGVPEAANMTELGRLLETLLR